MKKGLFILVFTLLPIPQAYANCPEGSVCEMNYNISTGITTYNVIPNTPTQQKPIVETIIIKPTHTLYVETTNQGLNIVGTVEQINASVSELVTKVVTPIKTNPCIEGNCSKMEINTATNVTTITALTASEIKQQTEDKARQLVRDAELAKVASKALPNIQPIEETTVLRQTPKLTPLTEEDPEWWEEFLLRLASFSFWFYSFNWYEL
jgi:hypothetical protein